MAKRKGNQKPTQSLILATRNNLADEAVKLYETTGKKAQKWQKDLLKAILARNKNGKWVHTRFGYSVPRRNGKNEVILMRELLALERGESVMHTAHMSSTSHSAWERLTLELDKAGKPYKAVRARGQEYVAYDNGGRVSFRTRTNKGGIGEGFDLLIIDEAQEYTNIHDSALKYVISASPNPQTIYCGTPPTPVSAGTIFNELRAKALHGESKRLGWAEWSVEESKDPYDKEAWYQANPSLGTILSEEAVEEEIGKDIVDFNIQRLGLWIKYNQKSIISELDWDDLLLNEKLEPKGKLHLGIKFGVNGENVAVSLAVKLADETIFIESLDCLSQRVGTHWIIDLIAKLKPKTIVVDGASGQSILQKELKELNIKGLVTPTVKEIITANAFFEKAIYAKTMKHKGQPSLRNIATNCQKRLIGASGGFGYQSLFEEYEVALLDSVVLAHWACKLDKEVKPPKVRY